MLPSNKLALPSHCDTKIILSSSRTPFLSNKSALDLSEFRKVFFLQCPSHNCFFSFTTFFFFKFNVVIMKLPD